LTAQMQEPKGRFWQAEAQFCRKDKPTFNAELMCGTCKNVQEIEESFTKIYKRDGWTCVQCGRRGCRKVMIHADHIRRLADLIEDFSIKTTDEAIACVAMWDINNGRTLCIDCHKETPTWGLNPRNAASD